MIVDLSPADREQIAAHILACEAITVDVFPLAKGEWLLSIGCQDGGLIELVFTDHDFTVHSRYTSCDL